MAGLSLKEVVQRFAVLTTAFIVVLAPLVLMPTVVKADPGPTDWMVVQLDSEGDVGRYPSIAVDSNDELYISYYDKTNGYLKYATNSNPGESELGNWNAHIIDDSEDDVGFYSSIAIDSYLNVHISYHDATNYDLKHAAYSNLDGSWTIQIIPSGGNIVGTTSIAIDSNNKVHISYCNSTNYDIMYATNLGGDWSYEIVSSAGGVGGGMSSLAVDSNGNAHITYLEYLGPTDYRLKYATNAGGSWANQTIDMSGMPGSTRSIALDANDKVHIVYMHHSSSDLKYATNAGGSWANQTIDSPGNVGPAASIAVDSNSMVHLSYYDAFNGDLKYATNALGSWTTEVVYSSGIVGWDNSIALDSDDRVYIAFYDFTNYDMKYAAKAPGYFEIQTLNAPDIMVGGDSSVAIDSNDFVHISYNDNTNGDLNYTTNSPGYWATQTVDSDGNVGMFNSIAIDANDKVHIAYYDETNGNLKYATNAGGSWTIKTADTADADVGICASIGLDSNNKVHISYYDQTHQNLKYTTNSGGSWTIQLIDHIGNVGTYCSLALDSSDIVHISYMDQINYDLKYATNAGGSWTNQTLDGDDDVGFYSSIAIDAWDYLHISYYDQTNSNLKYATNSLGYWSFQTVDNGEVVGHYSSIVVDSTGSVHIGYHDSFPNYDLRYATNSQGGWSMITLDSQGIVGYPTSLAIDSQNRLHISYLDFDNSDLKYLMMYIKPSAPLDLRASTGDSYIQLDWSPPEIDTGVPIWGYRVYRGLNEDNLELILWISNTLNFNDTDSLINGQTYYYRVSALNLFGEGASSETIMVIPGAVPSEPLSLTAVSGDSHVQLFWDPPSEDGGCPVEGYNIYKGPEEGELDLFDSATVTEFSDYSVTNGQQYFYRVTAFNAKGEGPGSEIVMAAPGTVPSPPQSLVQQSGDSYVYLSWIPPLDDGGFPIEEYNIYRGLEETSMEYLATVIDTPFNDTSVINGQTYFYQVTALNALGEGDPSMIAIANPATVPSAPEDLQAGCGDSYVLLTWIAPPDGGLEIEGYNLYRGESETSLSLLAVITALHYNDTSVINGQPYYYQVTAFNPLGEGPMSNMVGAVPQEDIVHTTPSAPLNLSAEAGDSWLALTWEAPEDNGGTTITHYMIYKGTSSGSLTILDTIGNALEFVDGSVTNGVTYHYQVSAVNAIGEGPFSNEASATPVLLTPPSAPNIIEVMAGDALVSIAWSTPKSDGGSPVEGYKIYRGVNETSIELLTMTADNAFNDTSVVNGQRYFYQVSAYNALGEGARSEIVNATPATTPSAPEGLQAQPGDSYVLLTWITPHDGGLEIEGYKIYRGVNETSLELLIMTAENSFNDTSVINDQRYFYQVSAYNPLGEGSVSNIVNATPMAGFVYTMPSAPLSLQADGGISSILLTWKPPEGNGGAIITSYHIYRGTSSGSKSVLATVNDTLQYVDDEVSSGVIYYYQVSAVNAVGEGALSDEASASMAVASAPSAPQDLSASPGDGRITLTWSAPDDDGGSAITNYRIYRATTSGSEVLVATIGNVLTYTDTGLVNGVTYYYKVSAISGIGNGYLSSEVIATPSSPTASSSPQDPQTSSGEGYVLITWSAPDDDGGSDITGYNIYRGTDADNLTLLASVPATQTSYNDTSVEDGQTYHYRITAVNDEGESAQSTVVIDTPGGEDGEDGGGDSTLFILIGVVVIIAVIIVAVLMIRRR